MRNVFFKLSIIIICFASFETIAQTSSLMISISTDADESHAFKVHLIKGAEVIGDYTVEDNYLPLQLDSLESGIYKIQLFDKKHPDEFMVQKTVTLLEDLQTSVDLTVYYSEETYEPYGDNLHQKSETQLNFGYFNGSWIDNSAIIKDNFSAGFDGYYWNAFSKHAGILAGAGFYFSQHYFRRDTSLFENIPFKKVFERYASINFNYELKFRFSTGNQQLEDLNSSKFFVDLGARYNLPVLFNHAAMYRGSKKVIERNIQNFTDFRAFVNIGFAPVSFFMEYRLSDFIRDDNPQLPKFNAGIKVTFDN